MSRPEWVNCVASPRDAKASWCGAPVGRGFVFTGVDHAIASMEIGSRLVPCPECMESAAQALPGYAMTARTIVQQETEPDADA